MRWTGDPTPGIVEPGSRIEGRSPLSWLVWDVAGKRFLMRLPVLIATAAGLGRLRPAPGTWASAAAAGLGWAILAVAPAGVQAWSLAVLALAAGIGGFICYPGARPELGGTLDPGPFVIDEVCGMLIALAIPVLFRIEPSWSVASCAFVAFRIFDILKPFPIRWLEHLPGAWGVMCDDIAAGVLAGVLTVALLR